MKRHIIYDVANGNIDSVITWGDDRDLPENYPLNSNQAVKTITDDSIQVDGILYCYNAADNTFHNKLTINCDDIQIDHLDGSANITVNYPDSVNEVCEVAIDGQTIEIDIVDGSVTFPFTSQVLGWHNISLSSSSFYGKDSINIEVI